MSARDVVLEEARQRACLAFHSFVREPTSVRLGELIRAVESYDVALAVRDVPSQAERAAVLRQRERAVA